jgi:hypothetical protein
MKLGKKAARFNPHALRLARYLDAAYVPPAFADHTPFGFTAWGMMLNGPEAIMPAGVPSEGLGDCTIAGCAHALQVFTGGKLTLADSVVLSYYEQWCGYVLGNENTDQGGDEVDVLNSWKSGGMSGHVLDGFADPQPQNWSHVAHSIAEFGGVYIGLQLPNSAMDQTNAGQIWDVVADDGGIAGGHAVFCPAYHTEDPTDGGKTTITAITWGMKQKMTIAFWDKYCDESHTLLASAWQPAGVNLAGLRADLAFMND